MGLPSMETMTSPGWRPALAAGAAGGNAADLDAAVGEAVHRGSTAEVGAPLKRDADGAADDFVLGTDEHVVDGGDGVGGHGEADALRARGLGVDGGVHADDLAGHIDQRAAGVAGVDGGVGLDELLELAGRAVGAGLVDGAVLGGDDAGGDGLGEGEGAADGEHPVADLGAVGVAELDGGERLGRVDLDDGDVGLGIDADDLGGTAFVVGVVGIGGELDVDLVGFVDDVVVGDDVAAGVDDEAGAEGLALAAGVVVTLVAALAALAAEEAVEEVLHVAGGLVVAAVGGVGLELQRALLRAAAAGARVGGLLGQGLGVDVDDGGADVLGDPGEAVGEVLGRGDDEGARVGGVDALLLAADGAGEDGAGEDADGERGEEREGGGEAVVADAGEKGRGGSVHRWVGP